MAKLGVMPDSASVDARVVSLSISALPCIKSIVVTCVFCLLLLSSSETNANPSYSCPVELEANQSNHCECNVVFDIHCYNLNAIPKFYRDENDYAGIYMEHQNISEILQAVFIDLKVRKIVLNFNPIGDKISVNAFSGLERVLEELHLGECGIQSLPGNLVVGLDRIKVLHLWNNHIDRIPDGFFRQTKHLKELILWGNDIRELTENSFAGLWELRKLDLDRNKIIRLERGMFRHFGKLEALYLGENSIHSIKGNPFTYLENLKVLHIDHNGLEYYYEEPFKGLRNLRVLNLQNNKLDYLSDGIFREMRNLTILWLQNNVLEFMWAKNFENLRNLQELHLSQNKLDHLTDRLLRGCNELAHLYLDNNKLKTIKKCSLPKRARLKTLSLVGNPITCDCRISWVQKLQNRKGTKIWGNCKHTPARILTSITDVKSYEKCSSYVEECDILSNERHDKNGY